MNKTMIFWIQFTAPAYLKSKKKKKTNENITEICWWKRRDLSVRCSRLCKRRTDFYNKLFVYISAYGQVILLPFLSWYFNSSGHYLQFLDKYYCPPHKNSFKIIRAKHINLPSSSLLDLRWHVSWDIHTNLFFFLTWFVEP